MPKFTRKPIVVDAVQFNGENAFEIWAFMERGDLLANMELQNRDHPVIETPDGPMVAAPGEWVIKDRIGFHVCPADIFTERYDPAETIAAAPNRVPRPNRLGDKGDLLHCCPCLFTTPCSPRCSCANPVFSQGCRRCCSHGSLEQQQSRARFLTKAIDVANEIADLAREIESDSAV